MTFQARSATVLSTEQNIILVLKMNYFPLQSAAHAVVPLSQYSGRRYSEHDVGLYRDLTRRGNGTHSNFLNTNTIGHHVLVGRAAANSGPRTTGISCYQMTSSQPALS